MTIQNEFKYNQDAKYSSGSSFNKKSLDLIKQSIIITADGKSFKADFPNIFEKYKLPRVASEAIVNQWNTDWLSFWQNQLNFAIWCATTGCGVDFENHIKAGGLTGSLFLFHVYYQTRRILFEIGVALPQDKSWNAFTNTYNRAAYERICKEFNVDPNTDWRQKMYPSGDGLGVIYTTSHTAWKRTDFRHNNSSKHIASSTASDLDLSKMTFGPEVSGGRRCGISSCEYLPPKKVHIDYLQQSDDVKDVWTTFILDTSKGFTRAGVERINETIRTYCWGILGSQSQTKTNILGTGTAFDAQKQFLANVEDAINSPVDLPTQITNYQNTLKYARSKVDYVYGSELYMSPSNMELQIGTIKDYNNEIIIATDDQELGLNNGVNTKPSPPKKNVELNGTTTKKTISLPEPTETNNKQPTVISRGGPLSTKEAIQHEENKTALIVGSIVIGIIAFTLYT